MAAAPSESDVCPPEGNQARCVREAGRRIASDAVPAHGENVIDDLERAIAFVALAAAAELDGGISAIWRAQQAVFAFQLDRPRFADSAPLALEAAELHSDVLCRMPNDARNPVEPWGSCHEQEDAASTAAVTVDPRLAAFTWVRARLGTNEAAPGW